MAQDPFEDVPMDHPGFALMLDRLAERCVPHQLLGPFRDGRPGTPLCDPYQARNVLRTLLAECAHIPAVRIPEEELDRHFDAMWHAGLLYPCALLHDRRVVLCITPEGIRLVRDLRALGKFDRRTADTDARQVLLPPPPAQPAAEKPAEDLLGRSIVDLLRTDAVAERLFKATIRSAWTGGETVAASALLAALTRHAPSHVGNASAVELREIILHFLGGGWLEADTDRGHVDRYDLTPEGCIVAGIPTPRDVRPRR